MEVLSIFIIGCPGKPGMSAHLSSWGFSYKGTHETSLSKLTTSIKYANSHRPTHLIQNKEHFYIKKSAVDGRTFVVVTASLVKEPKELDRLFRNIENATTQKELAALLLDPKKEISLPLKVVRPSPAKTFSSPKYSPKNRETGFWGFFSRKNDRDQSVNQGRGLPNSSRVR
jgi:hypothetical protein